jgi:predicted kinase
MLIILGGLPGTGKTTVARALAARLAAAHLRLDSIEQALLRSGEMPKPPMVAGYAVAYAVAEDCLRSGVIVVADSVNPVAATRAAWRDVAHRAGGDALEVGLICSDPAEHRRRVESRRADIEGHVQPTWQDVLDREFEPWPDGVLVVDTARQPTEESVAIILARLTSSVKLT